MGGGVEETDHEGKPRVCCWAWSVSCTVSHPHGSSLIQQILCVCVCVCARVLSCIRLLVTPWTAACQASLSITDSRSLLKLMMPSNHLILCHPLLLLPSVFPSIRVFSNESAPPNRWPKYWSFGSIGRVLEESFRVDFLQD